MKKIYKNKVTGAILETDFEIEGGNWEEAKAKKSKKETSKDIKKADADVKPDDNNMKQDDTPPQDGDGGDE